MSKTPVEWASLGLQAGLLVIGIFPKMPKAQPEMFQFGFVAVSSVFALVCSFIGISIGPGTLPVNPLILGAILMLLAIAAPVAGVIEARYSKAGQKIFARERFRPHLRNNCAGAAAATAILLAGRSTHGFDAFAKQYRSDAAFNIVLPLTVLVILAFVRVQQIDRCPQLDKLLRKEGNEWQQCIGGYSLKHWHQFINTVFMIVATFTAATMVLYLFAYAMKQAQHGQPSPLSPQLCGAIILLLVFFFACAVPPSKKKDLKIDKQSGSVDDPDTSGLGAVYLTFVTGTPAALIVALIWFALIKNSLLRNVVAAVVITGGYLLYTFFAVLGSRRDGDDRLQLHYFSGAAFAVVLIVLAGTLYYS